MKRFIGFVGAWGLFWIGHFLSWFVNHWPTEVLDPYRSYNWLMTTSCRIQDWAGIEGPWARNP